MHVLRSLLLIATAILAATAAEPDRFIQDFESLEALPDAWQHDGDVAVGAGGFNSARALTIKRAKADAEVPTRLVLPSFAARDGVYEVRVDHKSDLWDQDLSFNASLYLDALDDAGKELRKFEYLVTNGTHGWQPTSERLVLPPGTAAARFRIELKKTWGSVSFDNLSAAFVEPAKTSIFGAIKLKARAYAGLFYPGDDVIYDVTIAAEDSWPEAQRELTATITDYWGAEQMTPVTVALGQGQPGLYAGTLDLSGAAFEDGKYYEVRAVVRSGEADIARETSAFAILPRPVTKDYRPHEIPFTLNNWDDRVKDTFFMADRIGVRWKLIWAGWKLDPPYEPYAPGIEYIKELDMGAVLGPRPVGMVEKHRGDWKKCTPEMLKQGAYNLVMAYKDEVPIMIRCGNEPHTEPDIVTEAVRAYQAVYEGVKQADPDVFFIGTSIGPHEEFFKQGFQDYCDAFDYHTYSGWKRLRNVTEGYEEMFAKYDVEPKPIYCTEIGLNSQGMARVDVARDMAKKFAIHFAEGHANLAWFDLMYPDPKGTIAGSNGEAFNVFMTKYNCFAPKITAVMYYNLVNGICIKDFVQEVIYPEEIEAVLFRDVDDRNLLVLWDELGRGEHFLPLPGVGAVRLQRIDGSEVTLDAGGEGLHLSLTQDPILLHFERADLALAETLGAPGVALQGEPPAIVKGSSTTIELILNGVGASALRATAPFGWTVVAEERAAGHAAFRVTAPERTAATEGRILIHAADGSTELSVPLPVRGKLDVTVLPRAYDADGAAGLRVVVRNNGEQPETVRYDLALTETVPMAGGTFNLSNGQPVAPAYGAPKAGEVAVAGGEAVTIVLPVAELDLRSLYRARAVVHDAAGERTEVERYVSGFVGVPKLTTAIDLDAAFDDAIWAAARELRIDQEAQYRRYSKRNEASSWTGPEDLSASLRFLWDDAYLYLRADIVDEAYHHGEADSRLWAMDGLQILVDPNRETDAKSGYYDISMGQGAEGDQAYCHSSASPTVQADQDATGIEVRTRNGEGGNRSQVVAIPWAHLAPFTPGIGRNLGLAVIINEDDGPGRGSFMGWFGCVHSKQLDMVGDLILAE